jgi:hypothetical protein
MDERLFEVSTVVLPPVVVAGAEGDDRSGASPWRYPEVLGAEAQLVGFTPGRRISW